jgi:hypothetical protein
MRVKLIGYRVIFSGSLFVAKSPEAATPPVTASPSPTTCSIRVIPSLRTSPFYRQRLQLDRVRPTSEAVEFRLIRSEKSVLLHQASKDVSGQESTS